MSSLHFIENESNTSSLWRMNSFLANNEPQDWNSMKTKSTETSTSLSPQKKRFSIFPELERDKIAQVSGPDSFSSWTPWNGALKIIANDEDEESSKSSASNLPLHLDFSEDLNVERQASYLDDSGLQHSSFGLAGVDPLSPKSSVDTTTDSASMSNRKVWIGGISKDANESSLKKWLLEFGEIEDLSIVRDDNGISKGFAYVTFESSKSTQAFVNTPYIQFDGRPLSVKLAIPKEIMNLNKIYVSSLPFSITSDQLNTYFSQFGEVSEVVMKISNNRRFAFVRFTHSNSIPKVFAVDVHLLDGKRLICEKARCSVKKEDSERSADGNSSEFTGVFSKHEPSSSEELPKIQSDFKVQKPNKSQEEIDSRRIWVGGISKNLNDKELFQFFTSFGEVEQAFVVTDDRGRSKGFAYVTFSSPSSANLVLKADKVEIQGKIVTTKSALPESVMNKNKIYVCNLNEDTEELSLFNYFKQFGTVVEAVIKDAGSHRFAFVRFELKDSVERVFDISSHSIDGKVVHCERAYGSRRSAAKSYSVEGSRASDQSVSEVGAGSSASVYHQNKSRTPKLERFKLL